jgi:two-component system, OmpR family, response regulator
MSRVLLLGKTETDAEALARSLAPPLQDAGLTIAVGAGYRNAKRWLDDRAPDCPDSAVLDLGRSDPDGLALICQLRRVAPRTVIVALITTSTADDIVAVLHAGADDCISQPWHPAVVVARLRAKLRRRAMLGT